MKPKLNTAFRSDLRLPLLPHAWESVRRGAHSTDRAKTILDRDGFATTPGDTSPGIAAPFAADIKPHSYTTPNGTVVTDGVSFSNGDDRYVLINYAGSADLVVVNTTGEALCLGDAETIRQKALDRRHTEYNFRTRLSSARAAFKTTQYPEHLKTLRAASEEASSTSNLLARKIEMGLTHLGLYMDKSYEPKDLLAKGPKNSK